jgi:uncharacterized membrane protein
MSGARRNKRQQAQGASSQQHQMTPHSRAAKSERTEGTLSQVTIQSIQSLFNGPMPPPEMIAAYRELVPDAPERFFRMAEKQAEHRQDLEKYELRSDTRLSFAALFTGAFLTVICIAAAVWVAILGITVVAVALVGAPLAAIIVTIIRQGVLSTGERATKARILTTSNKDE